ncbi:acyltransferase [Blastococcus sp. SYSU D01042]
MIRRLLLFLASLSGPRLIRALLLRAAGVRTKTTNIQSGGFFGGPDIEIGAGAFINRECFFDVNAPISIGDGAHVGPRVMFLTSAHVMGAQGIMPNVQAQPISVGRGAWIGAGACLLPGTTVGEGAVIAAGAVVRGGVPDFETWGGVPARRLSRSHADE